MQLIIGNKNYSSWSLRPWLFMRVKGLHFDEQKIPLYADNSKQQLLAQSPAGLVPILVDDELRIWDSLAILEYLNERFPRAQAWPLDEKQRAVARSLCSEMHSGFFALRNQMPMNCRRTPAAIEIDAPLQADIERIQHIWQQCLEMNQGEFLFGDFGIIDAFFAPVVMRFAAYDVAPASAQIASYCQTIYNLPAMQDWIAEGIAEPEVISASER
ncbi:glutathione S-transferase family protein [Alteromonadaceae bacterium BrNp21-10]|nr:glutathione S-transferase family protein [Alteromonadaceae bacterium BrNp21-10]